MRQRNHKCERCGKIYCVFGSDKKTRYFCSKECRRKTRQTETTRQFMARYRTDPEFRDRILQRSKLWRVYSRSEESYQKQLASQRRCYWRKKALGQIGRLIRRIP